MAADGMNTHTHTHEQLLHMTDPQVLPTQAKKERPEDAEELMLEKLL